ncbi:MAG: response regulator transcription factor [Lactovum sp.]
MKKILIADDDPAIRTLLNFHFKKNNFEVKLATDGAEALDYSLKESFDLLILDVMMPELSGIELTEKIRSQKNFVPILILTARDDEEMRLSGLTLGADDYIDKTTAIQEIILRAKGLIRRNQSYQAKTEEIFKSGVLKIDFKKKKVFLEAKEIQLTKREFEILDFLVQRKGEVVSRDLLLHSFWGVTNTEVETRTIDVLVGRLRRKLNNAFIKSERGIGYRFDDYFKK